MARSLVFLLRLSALSTLVVSAACAIAACSSSTNSTTTPPADAGTESATGNDAEAGMPADSGADTGPKLVNDCKTFTDRSAPSASRKIQWDLAVVGIPERCMTIKAGQDVSWVNMTAVASFTDHPLDIYVGNQLPGTAPMVNTTTGVATFPTAGVYGFGCEIHAQMEGAITVLP